MRIQLIAYKFILNVNLLVRFQWDLSMNFTVPLRLHMPALISWLLNKLLFKSFLSHILWYFPSTLWRKILLLNSKNFVDIEYPFEIKCFHDNQYQNSYAGHFDLVKYDKYYAVKSVDSLFILKSSNLSTCLTFV